MVQALLERSGVPQSLYTEVLRYLVGLLEGVQFRRSLRKIGYTQPQITEIKKLLDSNDGSVARVWRAAFSLSDRDAEGARRFLPERDLVFLLEHLSFEDWRSLRQKARALGSYQKRCDVGQDVIEEIEKYCHFLCHKKLAFIVRSDPALAHEDVFGELRAAGIAALRWYDWESDPVKIKTRALKSAHNKAMQLIEHYTAKKRQRLRSQLDGNGRYSFTYTTSSIHERPWANDSETTLMDLINAASGLASDEAYKTIENMRDIFKTLGPKERLACLAFMGSLKGKVVDIWLVRCGLKEENLTDMQLMEAICRFYGASLHSMRSKLRPYWRA